jgi:hypothetical protein
MSRKTIAWGMPDDSGASAVNTRVLTYYPSACEAAGALGTRHSPRPRYQRAKIQHQLGAFCAAASHRRFSDLTFLI